MDVRRPVLQVPLWIVALSHLLIGAGAFLSHGFQVQVMALRGSGQEGA